VTQHLGPVTQPSTHARDQYSGTTGNLTARIALHRYGTNPQSWWEWLAARLPRAGRVLEVGAGTGELWQHLPHGPLVLVDFAPAMCAQLRTAVPDAQVLRADAAALPFAAGSFDTVIANHMLYHVDDPGAVLREFARILAPGGRVAIAVNGRDHMADLGELGGDRPARRLNEFSAETGPATMATVFGEVTVERYPSDLAVPSVEPVLAYLDSWTPLSPAERATAAARVQAQIDASGAFRVRKHTVLITGLAR
jgi:SAM-dependent methyltransferase